MPKTIRLKRKSDGVIRIYNEADVKANKAKFAGWQVAGPNETGPMFDGVRPPAADKKAAASKAGEGDDDTKKGAAEKKAAA